MKDEDLVWIEIQRKFLNDYHIFKTHSVIRQSKDGRQAPFYELETPDWVTIIARDKENRFLMVRQFRMGSASLTVEFPAGVVEPDEEPARAAWRELKEETGYEAGSIRLLGKINPNPAFMTNTSWTFLAEDLSNSGTTQWDENEIIHSFWMSEEEIDNAMGKEEMNSAIMVQAWFWYLKDRA